MFIRNWALLAWAAFSMLAWSGGPVEAGPPIVNRCGNGHDSAIRARADADVAISQNDYREANRLLE